MHLKGFWSLLTSRTHASSSGNGGTGYPSHYNDDDDHGLVSRTQNYPYYTQTKTIAEYGGANESMESTRYNGIHVVHNVEVA